MLSALIGFGFAAVGMAPAVIHGIACAILKDGSPLRRDWWTSDPNAPTQPLAIRDHLREARDWFREDRAALLARAGR